TVGGQPATVLPRVGHPLGRRGPEASERGRPEPRVDVDDDVRRGGGEHAHRAVGRGEADDGRIGGVVAGGIVHVRRQGRRLAARVHRQEAGPLGLGGGDVDGHGRDTGGGHVGRGRRPHGEGRPRGELRLPVAGVGDAGRGHAGGAIVAGAVPRRHVDDEVGGGRREDAHRAARPNGDGGEVGDGRAGHE